MWDVVNIALIALIAVYAAAIARRITPERRVRHRSRSQRSPDERNP